MWDLTAGLGRDATLLALASSGGVVMFERSVVMSALLDDALRRLAIDEGHSQGGEESQLLSHRACGIDTHTRIFLGPGIVVGTSARFGIGIGTSTGKPPPRGVIPPTSGAATPDGNIGP